MTQDQLEQLKLLLASFDRSANAQTNYWNFLAVVSVGLLAALASGIRPDSYMLIGFIVFWASNFQAIDRFQGEMLELKKRALELVPQCDAGQWRISVDTLLAARTVLPRNRVRFFHVLAGGIVMGLLVSKSA